jgi:hypothetical protein
MCSARRDGLLAGAIQRFKAVQFAQGDRALRPEQVAACEFALAQADGGALQLGEPLAAQVGGHNSVGQRRAAREALLQEEAHALRR